MHNAKDGANRKASLQQDSATSFLHTGAGVLHIVEHTSFARQGWLMVPCFYCIVHPYITICLMTEKIFTHIITKYGSTYLKAGIIRATLI